MAMVLHWRCRARRMQRTLQVEVGGTSCDSAAMTRCPISESEAKRRMPSCLFCFLPPSSQQQESAASAKSPWTSCAHWEKAALNIKPGRAGRGFLVGKFGKLDRMCECCSSYSFRTIPLSIPTSFAGSDIQLFSDNLVEQVMSSETLARLSQDAFHVDSMLSILKVLTETALGLQKDFDKHLRPVIHQLAKAVTSLPDEILALIFKFATLQEGTRQAILLSHVSIRFRRIALEEHSLWSTLHSSSKKEKLETSIARSGPNTDLHVIIHINMQYFDPRAFMDICYLTTPRWKTLTISESDDMHPDAGPTGDEVLKTISRYDDLQFLRLHELHITDYRSNAALEADEELRFKPTWSFPKLRILCCKGFVPTTLRLLFLDLLLFNRRVHFAFDLRRSAGRTIHLLDFHTNGYRFGPPNGRSLDLPYFGAHTARRVNMSVCHFVQASPSPLFYRSSLEQVHFGVYEGISHPQPGGNDRLHRF